MVSLYISPDRDPEKQIAYNMHSFEAVLRCHVHPVVNNLTACRGIEAAQELICRQRQYALTSSCLSNTPSRSSNAGIRETAATHPARVVSFLASS
jgi:hypothetical protein